MNEICGTCHGTNLIEVPIEAGDDTIWIPCPTCCPFDSAEELRAFEGIAHEDAVAADRMRDMIRDQFDGSDFLSQLDEPAWLAMI